MIPMPLHGGGPATMMSGHGMRMSGMSWPVAAASFVAMWTAMMAVMMLPSLAPAMWRYHHALGTMHVRRSARRTIVFGAGYLSVWGVVGLIVFALVAALTAAKLREPAIARDAPLASAVVFVVAGVVQLTRWKAHHLACCRDSSRFRERGPRRDATALIDGVRLGTHCTLSCAGPTAMLLAVGMMDLRATAVVTAAITAERIAPDGARLARATGVVAVGAGVLLIVRVIGIA